MSKKAILPESPHHVYYYDEDWEFLETRFGKPHGINPVGISTVLREKTHVWVLQLREAENRAATNLKRKGTG